MGQGKLGINRKAVPGKHSARKTIHKNKVRKRMKAKRRKKRKKNHKQQNFDKRPGESTGTIRGESTSKNMRNSNDGSKHTCTDDWKVDKTHQNEVLKDLRDMQAQMDSMLEDHLTPENHDTWIQFLNLMEGIVHIPRVLLEKVKYVTDIIFILKKQYCKTRIQAQSCLMKIIRKIDSSFVRKVDPIFKSIVELDRKRKEPSKMEILKGKTGKVNGICRVSKPTDLNTEGICRDELGNSNMGCAGLEKRGDNRKTEEKETIVEHHVRENKIVQRKCFSSRKRHKRRKTLAVKKVRRLRHNLPNGNLADTRVSGMMHRLESFGRWQHRNVRTGPLIIGGFSCKDYRTSLVECRDCRIVLDVFNLNGANPLEYHRAVAPGCNFFHEQDRRNSDSQTVEVANIYNQPSSVYYPNCNNSMSDLVTSTSKLQPMDTPSATNSFPEGLVPHTNQNDVSSGVLKEQQKEIPTRNPNYAEENVRRNTYRVWPHRATPATDMLVKAGFFYTGTADIVRCFHCDIGLAEWDQDDDPWVEHARHSPECPYLRDQKGQDFINSIQTQWARIYTPKNPLYTQANLRERTFVNSSWPRELLQTPEQLAAAGFFYTGKEDTVRCHYCNGGLREWEPEDDPWVEHARWFPFCKFVMKIKGRKFIQASAHENIPGIKSSADLDNKDPDTLTFVDACKILEQRNPMHSAAARSLNEMGYSKAAIRKAIETVKYRECIEGFKAVDLLNIILEIEEAGQLVNASDADDEDRTTADSASGIAGYRGIGDDDDDEVLAVEAIRNEIEHLREIVKCKICMEENCIVFLPCGHLITDQNDEHEIDTIPMSVDVGTTVI